MDKKFDYVSSLQNVQLSWHKKESRFVRFVRFIKIDPTFLIAGLMYGIGISLIALGAGII